MPRVVAFLAFCIPASALYEDLKAEMAPFGAGDGPCKDSPGYNPGEPLYGSAAFATYKGNGVDASNGAPLEKVVRVKSDVKGGCWYNFRMLPFDSLYIKIRRTEKQSSAPWRWIPHENTGYAVGVYAWYSHAIVFGGLPLAHDPKWWLFIDGYIWNSAFEITTDNWDIPFYPHMRIALEDGAYKKYYEDVFHCDPGCWGFVETEHVDEDLMIKLDTETDGGWDTYDGTYMVDQLTPEGKMEKLQLDHVSTVYHASCAAFRNHTDPKKGWLTSWSLGSHKLVTSRAIDDTPYCSWLQLEGLPDTWYSADMLGQNSGTCTQISGVACKDAVISMFKIDSKGLRNGLTTTGWEITKLSAFSIGGNHLVGPLPQPVVDATKQVSWFEVYGNLLTGSLPCWTGGDSTIQRAYLEYNLFSGTIPGDCWSKMPGWNRIIITDNDIRGSLPAALFSTGGFRETGGGLFVTSNLLGGTIPPSICDVKKMRFTLMGRNRFSGTWPSKCLGGTSDATYDKMGVQLSGAVVPSGWTQSYQLWASFNRFEGPFPSIFVKVQRLDFQSNDLTGDLSERLKVYKEELQLPDSMKELTISNNRLSGPLPKVFYEMLTWKNGFYTLDAGNNYFRCEKSGQYPVWAQRTNTGYDLGNCMPVPVGSHLAADITYPGKLVKVKGKDFMRTGNPRCKFCETECKDGAVSTMVAAAYVDGETIFCFTPSTLKVGMYEVTFSNMGEDWASKATLDDLFKPLTIKLTERPSPPDSPTVKASINLAGVTSETFYENAFKDAMAAALKMTPSEVFVEDVVEGSRRRLEAREGRGLASALSVVFHVTAKDEAASKAAIDAMMADGMEQTFTSKLISTGKFTTLTGVTYIEMPKASNLFYTSYDNPVPPWGLIGGMCIMLFFCGAFGGLLFFLYQREKAGRPFFMNLEEDDDDGGPKKKKKKGHFEQADDAAAAATPAAIVGKPIEAAAAD